MEYNWRYTNILINVFTANNSYGGISNASSTEENTLDKHNVFSNLFIIDLSQNEIEVPLFARFIVEHTLRDKVDKVVIPMYVIYNQSRKTADGIIAELFSKVYFNQRLLKITTGKGEVYYGGRGIILDKDFNILLLCSIIGRKIKSDEGKLLSYYRPVVHVNPKVFLNKECLISKSIIKKVIPFYLSHTIDLVNTSGTIESNIPIGSKPQILIDDVNRFIEKPTKPSPQNLNSVLNQVLIDNIDDVLDSF